MPRGFDLDAAELERAYLQMARDNHPDRFVAASASEQRAAMERSAAINEGYRTLSNPVRRAEYLVKLGGIDLDSSDADGGAPTMDQSFLIDMIERREAVTAARARGDAAIDDLREAVEAEADGVFEEAVAQLQAGDMNQAARTLVVRRYLQRLLDEIEDEVT